MLVCLILLLIWETLLLKLNNSLLGITSCYQKSDDFYKKAKGQGCRHADSFGIRFRGEVLEEY